MSFNNRNNEISEESIDTDHLKSSIKVTRRRKKSHRIKEDLLEDTSLKFPKIQESFIATFRYESRKNSKKKLDSNSNKKMSHIRSRTGENNISSSSSSEISLKNKKIINKTFKIVKNIDEQCDKALSICRKIDDPNKILAKSEYKKDEIPSTSDAIYKQYFTTLEQKKTDKRNEIKNQLNGTGNFIKNDSILLENIEDLNSIENTGKNETNFENNKKHNDKLNKNKNYCKNALSLEKKRLKIIEDSDIDNNFTQTENQYSSINLKAKTQAKPNNLLYNDISKYRNRKNEDSDILDWSSSSLGKAYKKNNFNKTNNKLKIMKIKKIEQPKVETFDSIEETTKISQYRRKRKIEDFIKRSNFLKRIHDKIEEISKKKSFQEKIHNDIEESYKNKILDIKKQSKLKELEKNKTLEDKNKVKIVENPKINIFQTMNQIRKGNPSEEETKNENEEILKFQENIENKNEIENEETCKKKNLENKPLEVPSKKNICKNEMVLGKDFNISNEETNNLEEGIQTEFNDSKQEKNSKNKSLPNQNEINFETKNQKEIKEIWRNKSFYVNTGGISNETLKKTNIEDETQNVTSKKIAINKNIETKNEEKFENVSKNRNKNEPDEELSKNKSLNRKINISKELNFEHLKMENTRNGNEELFTNTIRKNIIEKKTTQNEVEKFYKNNTEKLSNVTNFVKKSKKSTASKDEECERMPMGQEVINKNNNLNMLNIKSKDNNKKLKEKHKNIENKSEEIFNSSFMKSLKNKLKKIEAMDPKYLKKIKSIITKDIKIDKNLQNRHRFAAGLDEKMNTQEISKGSLLDLKEKANKNNEEKSKIDSKLTPESTDKEKNQSEKVNTDENSAINQKKDNETEPSAIEQKDEENSEDALHTLVLINDKGEFIRCFNFAESDYNAAIQKFKLEDKLTESQASNSKK